MLIKKDSIAGYDYSFEFEFKVEIVNYCRHLNEKHGFRRISFFDKKWRIKDLYVIVDIKNRYPEAVIDGDMALEYELAKYLNTQSILDRDNSNRIKASKESSTEIKNIKANLFPYQKVGVDFFVANNGTAINSDPMGCLSGDTIIQVNKGGNCRKYSLKDAYERFNGLSKNKRNNWKLESYIRSYNEDTREFFLNKVKKIIYSGVKDTITLEAKSKNKKYKIELTDNHEIMTPGGWVPAGKLKAGSEIITNHPDTAVITSINKCRKQDVYDLIMEDPYRNFLANDIVVHNSGKSLQSIAYAIHSDFDKVLVICPASVKYNWENEVKKFTYKKPVVINSSMSCDNLLKELDGNFFIVNYDIVNKFLPFISSVAWDLMILDEFHMIKNNKAKRTKIVKKIAKIIPRKILLSGTPFLNRPSELFNGLSIVDPKTWSDYYDYTRQYCDGFNDRYGWNDKGASNLIELQERISPYFIRRKKSDILPDLPKKRFINCPVELDKKTQEEYAMAEKEFARFLMEVKKKNKAETKRTLQAEKLAKLGALRQLTSNGKIDIAREMIENVIDSGEKIIVFSVYNSPLETLHKHFGDKSVLLTGKLSAEKRAQIVNDFQNKDDVKIFFGGLKSAGVGINLIASTNVLFLDFSWVPADHAQGIDRCHRVGSTSEHITIYQLYSKNTVDEYMYNILEKKQLLFNQIIDGEVDDKKMSGNYYSSIVKAIEKRNK